MITTRRLPVEMELLRWAIVAAIALALLAALATVVAAAEPMPAPALLPARMELFAKPLDLAAPDKFAPDKPRFPEAMPAIDQPPAEMAARLWMTLENHRAGCFGEALAGWQQIQLPDATVIWGHIAHAALMLQVGDLEQAAIELDLARRMDLDHPLVAYYTGILRLEQAAQAARIPDGMPEGNLRLVAHVPARGEDRAEVYRMLARVELGRAIALADRVRLDERLIATEDPLHQQLVVPHVGDLLVALGADNFVGKAHQMLFDLDLARGELTQAEQHLDAAVALGLPPLFGYHDLAEAYQAADRPEDALRAVRRDLQANYPALWDAGQDLMRAWDGMWVD
jgi:tetratricopeptide (TPR) repeat protein